VGNAPSLRDGELPARSAAIPATAGIQSLLFASSPHQLKTLDSGSSPEWRLCRRQFHCHSDTDAHLAGDAG